MSDCGFAGANFNPGTYHPEGSVIGTPLSTLLVLQLAPSS